MRCYLHYRCQKDLVAHVFFFFLWDTGPNGSLSIKVADPCVCVYMYNVYKYKSMFGLLDYMDWCSSSKQIQWWLVEGGYSDPYFILVWFSCLFIYCIFIHCSIVLMFNFEAWDVLLLFILQEEDVTSDQSLKEFEGATLRYASINLGY